MVCARRQVPSGSHSAVRNIEDAAYSPDGRWIVTAGPITAALLNTKTVDTVFLLRGHEERLTRRAPSDHVAGARVHDVRGAALAADPAPR